MRITTRGAIQEYMARELQAVSATCPGWTVKAPADSSKDPLSLNIEYKDSALAFWYTVEARTRDEEFLIWFGNYQIGVGQVQWIMRPAVHIGFADVVKDHLRVSSFSLGDVLSEMIHSLENPGGLEALHFQPNTFSMT